MRHRENRAALARYALVLSTLSAFLLVSPALAQEGALPKVRVHVPGELRAHQHVTAELQVELPAQAARPLLITPFRAGESIEVVRGRLLRSEGREQGGVLRFELPLRTHGPGSAVLGVRLLAYLCHEVCRRVLVETRVHLVVLAP